MTNAAGGDAGDEPRAAASPVDSPGNPDRSTAIPLSTAAVVAGVGLLLMAILSAFSFVTLQNLVVSGDATATATTIADNDTRFRAAIAGFLLVIVLDILVAWALYEFFKPVDRSLSLLAAWLRLLYAPIFAVALNNLMEIVDLLNNGAYADAMGTDQLHAAVLRSYNAFEYGWDIGLLIFGLHLLVLGYLAVRADYVPTVLGAVLMFASIGYVVDSVGTIMVPDYGLGVAAIAGLGEVLFLAWLLYAGRKLRRPGRQ